MEPRIGVLRISFQIFILVPLWRFLVYTFPTFKFTPCFLIACPSCKRTTVYFLFWIDWLGTILKVPCHRNFLFPFGQVSRTTTYLKHCVCRDKCWCSHWQEVRQTSRMIASPACMKVDFSDIDEVNMEGNLWLLHAEVQVDFIGVPKVVACPVVPTSLLAV